MKMIQKNENNDGDGDRYWVRKSVVNDLAKELDLAIKDYKVDRCPDLSFPEAMLALQVLTANKIVEKVNLASETKGLEVVTDTQVSQENGA